MIGEVRSKIAKSGRSTGQRWAILDIEDLEGKIEGMLFAETYAQLTAQNPDLIKAESICFLKGKIDRKRETPSMVITDVIAIADAAARLTTAVALKLQHVDHGEESLKRIVPLLAKHKGNCEVYAQVEMPDSRKVVLRVHKDFYVRPTDQLVRDLDHVLGNGAVQLFGAGQRRKKRQQQQQKMFAEDQAIAEANLETATVTAVVDAEMKLEEESE
ncbi:MAG TPA: hypothetical protein VKK61_07030 [Tepidisphaeraceae bacterium]|nr:hypothetical protein [Tepidisphaeraceae bacterium]